MATRTTAADIQQAGVTIRPEEALAIAQQLIATFRSGVSAEVVEPPFGPPTTDRVVLCEDGSVVCRGCDTTPAVSEVAMLLQSLLPPPPARMPGGLRYTIARALLDVDVAPFDSLDDLSETLARYERGPRDQLVIRLLERFAASRGLAPVKVVERRRNVQVTELRRALREADARLYAQKLEADAAALTPLVESSPPASRWRAMSAIAACVAAGVLFVTAGAVMHHGDGVPALPPVAAPSAAVEPPVTSAANPRLPAVATPAVTQPGARAVVRTSTTRNSTVRRAAARPVVKRTSQPTPRVFPQPKSRSGPRDGLLDRLRLRWLRELFADRRAG